MADNKYCKCNKVTKNNQCKPSNSSEEPKEQEWNPFCKCSVHCQHVKQNAEGNLHVFN